MQKLFVTDINSKSLHVMAPVLLKNWLKSIPREQPSQNKGMKIADSDILSLYMRDNEICNISRNLSTGLLIPRVQKKYNNTEMKSGRLFTFITEI